MTTLNEFLKKNEGTAYNMAMDYKPYVDMHPEITMEDMRQAARLALSKAYYKYKPGGLSIQNYARRYLMRGEKRKLEQMVTDEAGLPEYLPYEHVEQSMDNIDLHRGLRLLDERDRNMIVDHFGFYDFPMNWDDLGSKYNMQPEEAQEIVQESIMLLRDHWGVSFAEIPDTVVVRNTHPLVCNQGHELRGGNLRPQYDQPGQQCRACNNARSWLSQHQPAAGAKRDEFREKNFLPKASELYDKYITE